MDTAEQILAQLDDVARDNHFRQPEHPYYSAIDPRLHVFRDVGECPPREAVAAAGLGD